ncbi:AsmA family protein, partial [candidate division KSB1 bacterium]|nr:AsmA family protein [candidate division KSB1 bacterium]
MKKILKISALAVVGLILLTVGIAFYTQTAQFKGWLKKQIESQFASMTNGQIEIENIDGNLVTSFKIKDFAIRLNQDTLASVKRLSFRFRPIALLSKRIVLNQIRLEEPRIFLVRNSDSRWNFQDLIEVAAKDSLTSVKEINDENKWAINAKLKIISGLVQISKHDSTEWRGPWLVRDLNLTLDLEKKNEELHLSLKDVNFETHNPDILIQSLQGKVVFATNRLEVIDFELMTESSNLTLRIGFDNLDNSGIDFLLEAQPLNFDEVRIFWPDFPLQGSPNIKVVANGPVDSLAVAADLYFSEGVFSVKGTAGLRGSDIQLDLGGQTSNLNLAALTKNSAYKTDLNSQFSVLGTGHVNGDFDGEIRVKLDTSVAMGRDISKANLFLAVEEDSALFSLQTRVEAA